MIDRVLGIWQKKFGLTIRTCHLNLYRCYWNNFLKATIFKTIIFHQEYNNLIAVWDTKLRLLLRLKRERESWHILREDTSKAIIMVSGTPQSLL